MRKWTFGAGALLMASAMMPGLAAAAPRSPLTERGCQALARRAFGPDVRLLTARHVAAASAREFVNEHGWRVASAIPAYCRIDGVIGERKGEGGKVYGIRFALALPDAWNGRFLLQGGGGLNGSVLAPLGPVASDGRPALARGFAVISDDSGHEGAVFDAGFMADQRAALDFAETSVRTVTLLGKRITSAYYRRPIAHSYMTGCSTGGREAMLAAQRYPELFDGIVAGAPAMRTGDSNLALEYTQVVFNQAAPAGASSVARALSAADRATILTGLLNQCDGLDGLKDGMIENVAQCRFNPALLTCKAGETGHCLDAATVRAIKLAFAGPKDKAGYPIYAPVPYDTGIVANPMGYLPSGAPGPFGPPTTATSIDLDARIHAIRQDAVQRLTDTSYWTNLNTFLGHGGKILFFHGVSDFWFSALATWDYYQRARQASGTAFTDASRFYMVPGMLHCQGGNSFDQFDMLTQIVDWVEAGKAPQAIVASRRPPARETRPLCPYPAYARYMGGDPKLSTSFQCTQPRG